MSIYTRSADLIARICLTTVVLVDLLMGFITVGAPQAWLELLGMDGASEDLIRASRDIGLMLIALALGGFFVLWSGPSRQRPMMAALWFATLGLTVNVWSAEWAGPEAGIWNLLAVGCLLNLLGVSLAIMRWWSLLELKVMEASDDDLSDEMVEDELTETASSSVLLGSDEAMDVEEWEQESAPWGS